MYYRVHAPDLWWLHGKESWPALLASLLWVPTCHGLPSPAFQFCPLCPTRALFTLPQTADPDFQTSVIFVPYLCVHVFRHLADIYKSPVLLSSEEGRGRAWHPPPCVSVRLAASSVGEQEDWSGRRAWAPGLRLQRAGLQRAEEIHCWRNGHFLPLLLIVSPRFFPLLLASRAQWGPAGPRNLRGKLVEG